MNIENEILEELRTKDLENGVYDTSLESVKNLDSQTRRKIMFDLDRKGIIQIKHIKQNNDASFPLIIIDCIK